MLREPATSGFRELTALMCHVLASRAGARTLQAPASAAPETMAWQTKPQQQRGGYRGGRGRARGRGRGAPQHDTRQQQSTMCGNCGKGKHQPGEACPAAGKECHGCRKIGHFREVCRSNGEGRAYSLEDGDAQYENDDAEAGTWVGAITAPCVLVTLPGSEQPDPIPPLQATRATVRPTQLRVPRTVKAAKIDFLADTGANLTCIDVQLLPCFKMTRADLVGTNPPPRVPAQAGAAKTGLRGVGLFKAKIEVGSGSTVADIYVYEGLRRPLLARQHCKALDVYREGSNNSEAAALVDED